MTTFIENNDIFIFKEFIQKYAGLYFPISKFTAAETLIRSLLEESPCSEIPEFIHYLKSKQGQESLKKIISLLTTNETYFFRGKPYFDALEKYLLPKIIDKESTSSKTISIWSAGCSTGEEAYSIAILLKRLIPRIDDWQVEVIGTDLDEKVLENAMQGEYRDWSFRGSDQNMIHRAFTKSKDVYRINAPYRSIVTFKHHNLVSDPPPKLKNGLGKFDVIFCRNVSIYFSKETTIALSKKFFQALKNEGYLVVGDSEHSAEIYASYKPRTFPDAIIYQKDQTSIPEENKGQEYLKVTLLSKKQQVSKTNETIAPDENRDTLNAMRYLKPSSSSEEHRIFIDAMHAYFNKEYERAIDCFLKNIAINPRDAHSCWMISHIFSNRGDFEEAIAWSNKAIKSNMLLKEPYYTIATIYMAQGLHDEALKNIKKALNIDPDFILGHYLNGSICQVMNLIPQAEKSFENAQTLLSSKATDEIIFESEFLAVGVLKKMMEQKVKSS